MSKKKKRKKVYGMSIKVLDKMYNLTPVEVRNMNNEELKDLMEMYRMDVNFLKKSSDKEDRDLVRGVDGQEPFRKIMFPEFLEFEVFPIGDFEE